MCMDFNIMIIHVLVCKSLFELLILFNKILRLNKLKLSGIKLNGLVFINTRNFILLDKK